MSESKGQGAMEYLMNYGWVIVIVVIIGASLWYLGIFDLEQSATSYEGFARIRPLVESVIFTTDGDFATKFVNGAGNMITVNNISVVNHDGTVCHCIIEGSNIIRAGNAFEMGGTACSSDHNVGDPFLIYLTINYTMNIPSMDVERIENGTIRGRYGGAIGDIIPADSDIQGCLGISGYWLGNQYCLGGDDCAQKPKCCGDDPAEYYKSSWSTACCGQESSCSGTITKEHWCFIEGTPGLTGGYNNLYLCDDGGWLQCPSGGECTIKHSYICTQHSDVWLWRASPASDDPDRCSGNSDGRFYCNVDGVTWENRNYYCSGESCTYDVDASYNCNNDDDCYTYGSGCEERDYSCSEGSCPYTYSNRNTDGCSGDDYEDYYCAGSSCTYSPDDCSASGNADEDAVACNCDCNGYDVEESDAGGNCEDEKDNDCDGTTDCEPGFEDPDCSCP